MSLHDDDRTIYDDERADRATRDEAEAALAFIDAMRQRIREFVRAEANLLALTLPRFIDVRDWRSPSSPFALQVDEAIEGFVECVGENFSDLLAGSELETARNIAENGYD